MFAPQVSEERKRKNEIESLPDIKFFRALSGLQSLKPKYIAIETNSIIVNIQSDIFDAWQNISKVASNATVTARKIQYNEWQSVRSLLTRVEALAAIGLNYVSDHLRVHPTVRDVLPIGSRDIALRGPHNCVQQIVTLKNRGLDAKFEGQFLRQIAFQNPLFICEHPRRSTGSVKLNFDVTLSNLKDRKILKVCDNRIEEAHV